MSRAYVGLFSPLKSFTHNPLCVRTGDLQRSWQTCYDSRSVHQTFVLLAAVGNDRCWMALPTDLQWARYHINGNTSRLCRNKVLESGAVPVEAWWFCLGTACPKEVNSSLTRSKKWCSTILKRGRSWKNHSYDHSSDCCVWIRLFSPFTWPSYLEHAKRAHSDSSFTNLFCDISCQRLFALWSYHTACLNGSYQNRAHPYNLAWTWHVGRSLWSPIR